MIKKFWLVVEASLLATAVGLSVGAAQTNNAGIVRFDPAVDAILPGDAKLEMLPADGFEGGEGPVWINSGKNGYLLFSDIPGNRIEKWTPDCFTYPCPVTGKLSVYLEHAGTKDAGAEGMGRGTNGLTT